MELFGQGMMMRTGFSQEHLTWLGFFNLFTQTLKDESVKKLELNKNNMTQQNRKPGYNYKDTKFKVFCRNWNLIMPDASI